MPWHRLHCAKTSSRPPERCTHSFIPNQNRVKYTYLEPETVTTVCFLGCSSTHRLPRGVSSPL